MLSINLVIKESDIILEEIVESIKKENEIETIKIIKTQGIGETILISVASTLIADVLKKMPKAISRLKKIIRRLLKIGQDKNLKDMKVVIFYEVLTLNFYSDEDKKIDTELEKLFKYLEK